VGAAAVPEADEAEGACWDARRESKSSIVVAVCRVLVVNRQLNVQLRIIPNCGIICSNSTPPSKIQMTVNRQFQLRYGDWFFLFHV
jgi:hypothetical protein